MKKIYCFEYDVYYGKYTWHEPRAIVGWREKIIAESMPEAYTSFFKKHLKNSAEIYYRAMLVASNGDLSPLESSTILILHVHTMWLESFYKYLVEEIVNSSLGEWLHEQMLKIARWS